MTVPALAMLLVLALQGWAISSQSLIGDAPYHLLAGDLALREGQNRLNLEHPPLVKMVAAAPLQSEIPLAPPPDIDGAIATSLELFEDPQRTRRAQLRARSLLLVVFVLPLLVLCGVLGNWWGGPRAGWTLAAIFGLSFSVLPFLTVIQTDAAVTVGYLLTLVALLRYLESPTSGRAALVGCGLGLALATKFSGALLVPSVLLAVMLAKRKARQKLVGVGRDVALVGLATASVVWLTYAIANRSYDSAIGRDTIERYLVGEGMITDQEMQRYGDLLLATEKRAPSLAQWATGFLGIRVQNDIGVYPGYAFGSVTSQGRWWYFPAVFLIKTPLALLVALVAAGFAFARRPSRDRATVNQSGAQLFVVGFTLAVYLGAATSSNYNLGLRHLMPILPILYLPASLWAARSQLRTLLLVGALAVESLTLAPLWMSATNTWWLGSANPTRFVLGGADTEYRQNFIALANAARERGIEQLHVVYPLLDERELLAYCPTARLAEPSDSFSPGDWIAVNINVEQYLPAILKADPKHVRGYEALRTLGETWTPLWHRVRQGEDHGYVAGTFHLYRVPL